MVSGRRRIWVIATDSAGCWYYRLHLPLTHLDPEQWEVIWRGPESLGDVRPGDVVIGQRLADDNAAWRELGARDDITTVYDLDDNLLAIDPGNTIPYSIYSHPEVIAAIKRNLAAAHVVTVTTQALADVVRAFNPNVVVLQNCIAPDRVAMHAPNAVPTIGWAGSPFHAQDWFGSDVAALQSIHAQFPDVAFRTIGADYMGVPNRHTGWTTMEHYWANLDFDIGIAPLADTPFNACKSWIKALEYMSRGIVPVVPMIGQYPELLMDRGETGDPHGVLYFSGIPTGLFDSLRWVLGLRSEQGRMATAALETARRWTIDKQVHRWQHVYEGDWSR